MKNNKAVYVTCHHTFAMQNGLKKHVQEEHTELWQIVAKCSEIERKQTISCMKHVNQPVMNGPKTNEEEEEEEEEMKNEGILMEKQENKQSTV